MSNNIFFKYKSKLLAKQVKDEGGQLTNKDISLFCNNCVGGIILSDLKQRFNSPTVNLYFHAPDYITFLERLEYYLHQEITFSYYSKYEPLKKDYPIGTIKDVEMHFVHYHSFEEASEKWRSRAERVNMDNLFIIGSDRDFCTAEIVDRFLKLPFKNKLFLSSKKIDAPGVVYFKEYANDKEVGDLISDDHAWYFHFNVVKWLNKGKLEKNALVTTLFLGYRYVRKKYQHLTGSQQRYEAAQAAKLA